MVIIGLVILASSISLGIGSQFVQMLFGSEYQLSNLMLSIVLFSSGMLAIQIVSGSLILSRGHHGSYILGWIVAAVATVLVLLTPLAFEVRVMLSLNIGPISGIFSNALSLVIQEDKKK